MLRIVCSDIEFGLTANITGSGADVVRSMKTFDIDGPDVLALEQWLSAYDGTKSCVQRSIVGFEVVDSWECPQCEGAGWYCTVGTNAAGDGPEEQQVQCDCEAVRREQQKKAREPKKPEPKTGGLEDDIPF